MSAISQTRIAPLEKSVERKRTRHLLNRTMPILFAASLFFGFAVLAVLSLDVLIKGWSWISFEFFTNLPSRHAEKAGIFVPIIGTLWIAALTALICFPIGIGSAIWLEEYAHKHSRIVRFITLNIANLAGVPSIIYGLLGLALFVYWLDLGRSVLAGAFTMTLLVLPLVIVVTREAIRAVPDSERHAAYALGATKLQVVRCIVLPRAFPAILTGNIFAMARAVGETAPMIAICALVYLTVAPTSPLDRFTVLPIQLFSWITRPQAVFHEVAAAGIVVLLVIIVVLNGPAIYFRNKFQKRMED